MRHFALLSVALLSAGACDSSDAQAPADSGSDARAGDATAAGGSAGDSSVDSGSGGVAGSAGESGEGGQAGGTSGVCAAGGRAGTAVGKGTFCHTNADCDFMYPICGEDGRCGECQQDSDCGPTAVCFEEVDTRYCRCGTDADCKTPRPFCTGLACGACREDADCGAMLCHADPWGGYCSCETDAQCPASAPHCSHLCYQCLDSSECPSGLLCDPLTASCTLACSNAQPMTMVKVPEGYSMDATEVTRCQYQLWLETKPSVDGQPTDCEFNTRFEPSCWVGPQVCQGCDCGNDPVVCVDWCDAQAYCKSHGKRLCGKIGGGILAFEDRTDATASQWHNGCVSGAVDNTFTYGSTYDAHACNSIERWGVWFAGTTRPVGSLPECQSPVSGYQGIFDLTGNVAEWEDACTMVGNVEHCSIRGGSFQEDVPEEMLWCSAANWFIPRIGAYPNLGFRCCSDP